MGGKNARSAHHGMCETETPNEVGILKLGGFKPAKTSTTSVRGRRAHQMRVLRTTMLAFSYQRAR